MSRLFCWAGSVSLCLAFSTTAQASFELISRTDGEPTVVTEPNGGVGNPSISANGRFVAFASDASNLVAGDSGVVTDIFLYDLDAGTLRSITANGNDDSRRPAISADGRFVAFESRATNLVADDTNGAFDIFVYDAVTDTLELLAQGGGQGNFDLAAPSISADGRIVVFDSRASNLAAGDTNGGVDDVFLYDRNTNTTELLTAGGNNLRRSL